MIFWLFTNHMEAFGIQYSFLVEDQLLKQFDSSIIKSNGCLTVFKENKTYRK